MPINGYLNGNRVSGLMGEISTVVTTFSTRRKSKGRFSIMLFIGRDEKIFEVLDVNHSDYICAIALAWIVAFDKGLLGGAT